MAKPRIIIADTDYGYIIPVQQKFITELFGEIDLEIVTDPTYLLQFFSKPQKADILIISEQLYSPSLVKKQSIKNIFLLTERYDYSKAEDDFYVPIYKYTSVKEIYSEIMGPSGLSLHSNKSPVNGTKAILVTSAIGGAGKTTIAFALAAGLAKAQKRVLYVDAENIQAFQYRMTNALPITGNDVYSELVKPNCHPYPALRHHIRTEFFSYLPPFKASLISLGLNGRLFVNFLEEAKEAGDYDFIVVDSETSFDEIKTDLLADADNVIFVTKQDELSVKATNRYVSNLNNVSSDKYLFICNDFSDREKNEIMSSTSSLLFSVSEYINHLPPEGLSRLADLGKTGVLQRIAYLYI